MKYIDMASWPRKKHFEFFTQLDFPHFNLTANVDISTFYPFLKEHQLSFFKTVLYVATKTANAIPEFRQRIRENQVVEHDMVHPSVTVMAEHEIFTFCPVTYTEDVRGFFENATQAIENVQNNVTLDDEPGRDDLLFMTSMPWVAFTGTMHPIHMHPVDSIPRIAWGKFFDDNGKYKLPLSVQVHHAVVDGIHVGRYYEQFQTLLDHPGELLN